MMIDWDALLPVAEVPPIELEPKIKPVSKSNLPRERDNDNRRRCAECGNLNERGLCLAAVSGEIVASHIYTPIRDLLRRCEGFKPMPNDPDQRTGRDRWGLALRRPDTS